MCVFHMNSGFSLFQQEVGAVVFTLPHESNYKVIYCFSFNFRDEEPVPDGPFFTRDLYDTYSLAPHIRELWDFLQRLVCKYISK